MLWRIVAIAVRRVGVKVAFEPGFCSHRQILQIISPN
jgi:hypothetical protein